MKRVLLLAAGLVLLLCLFYFNSSDKNDFFGKYNFKKVSYLSLLSSSTVDFLEEKPAGTVYTIEADIFKIEFADDTVEIKSPNYVKEEIPGNPGLMSDVRSFIGNNVKYQYTIYNKDGNKTNWRLYVSQDNLWVASYADNTADGSEIIMFIYELSK